MRDRFNRLVALACFFCDGKFFLMGAISGKLIPKMGVGWKLSTLTKQIRRREGEGGGGGLVVVLVVGISSCS